MAKRIAIATIGTQGDVQPYVALAVALRDRGYSVVLGAPNDFREMIEAYGLDFFSLGRNIQAFVKQSNLDEIVSKSVLTSAPRLMRQGQKIVEIAARRSWEMAQGADLLIANMNTTFCIDIGEALDIPVMMSALQPLTATSEFPIVAYDGPDLGPAFNYISHAPMNWQQMFYDWPRNKLRKALMGMEPRKKGGFFKDNNGIDLPALYAYSSHVSRRPDDWPQSAHVCGYWQLKDQTGWEPSESFKEFLANGSKPIYVGFGSMPFGAERNTQILKEAVAKWGGRLVVGRGWGGINPDDLPDSIYAIRRAPHDKLFKYVAGVVHHGGAGTTSAGLHAGKPAFVVPQTMDQPFWGRRVHQLGCGPKPVPLRKLTSDDLAYALRQLATNRAYKAGAEAIAAKLNAEDGCQRACDIIGDVITNYESEAVRRGSAAQ